MSASAFARTAMDQAQRRHAWRQLAEAGQALAERLIASDGAESVGEAEFTFGLATTGKIAFERPGDNAAQALSQAFVLTGRATLKAGTERRRAILAGGLKGLAEAVDALITDDGDVAAQQWKRQTGEDD